MGSYFCIENDIKNPKFTKDRIIVVTHTVILILELNPEHPGIGYLISWATLQSLNTIKRSLTESDRITLEWKKIGENPAYFQQFKIPTANEFVDLISRNMQKIGAVVKRQGNTSIFNEDEVNGKAIKTMKIHEILQAIEVYEDILENSMSVDMINNLLALYQQAIEYFAAVSNPQFDVFLKRMHMLLANEDVLNLLQGKEVKNNEKIANKSEDKESLNKLEHKENTNKFEEKDIVDELEEKKTVEREEKNIFEQLEDKTFEVKETIDEQKRPDALETNYFENDKNSEIQTDKIVEKGADNKNFEENEVKRNPDESESKEENTQIIIEEKIVEERTQIIIEENTQIKIDEN